MVSNVYHVNEACPAVTLHSPEQQQLEKNITFPHTKCDFLPTGLERSGLCGKEGIKHSSDSIEGYCDRERALGAVYSDTATPASLGIQAAMVTVEADGLFANDCGWFQWKPDRRMKEGGRSDEEPCAATTA